MLFGRFETVYSHNILNFSYTHTLLIIGQYWLQIEKKNNIAHIKSYNREPQHTLSVYNVSSILSSVWQAPEGCISPAEVHESFWENCSCYLCAEGCAFHIDVQPVPQDNLDTSFKTAVKLKDVFHAGVSSAESSSGLCRPVLSVTHVISIFFFFFFDAL